ncbi:RraA family protein [Rhodococcus sp. BP-349]|uniref:RraA family protein n=1 Tax=unclassified Rhodococcus (in: high G+C Gram-positive bacteria) TaxID=192944 RepID=UPI001C9B0E71|nr:MULTISPECIES: demethylmenaquinone methyltransferase [unclassified Rhodococcus (in: high G+C Gram-positive bacteria)]MBY6537722.1 RraA family protein [Rhodococcus sp. BP-363]MBY6542059.1 RraA family protein [Rhodococcus sp. BP-369]MBY6561289.1 RraA family protein [Rhodococcus sp. BP-370]MBY6575581.1 RraA family protein [Rhodococcus sp. BP-364]MBY6584882.1 RraA family protein [Rhodococcus sp. BP-358]
MSECGRLAALDTCAVSDALDALRLPGAALGLHAVSGERRIAGRAVTVDLVEAEGAGAAPRHLCTAAVDASGPDTIIVVAHHGRSHVAGWGGVLSAGAVARGSEGVIVDGAVRDLDEARQFGLTVYAATSVPVTARTRVVERAWDVPVEIAGVRVEPGDYVLADGSGVVFVPRDRIDEVLAIAERIAAKEALMLARVREGESMATVMSADYETMLDREASR